ncbi:MAG: BACON domain-containing protein, partial [Acidimicrobiales bacterium]
DVPWLSASPTSGTTPAGGSEAVTVSVDATGLTPGDYSALLCATTNDPAAELVEVPVDLTVTEGGDVPEIEVDPDSMSFTLPAGGSDADDLGVSNIGEGTLSWTIDTAEPPAGLSRPTAAEAKAEVMAREARLAAAGTGPKTRLLPSERPAPEAGTPYVSLGEIVGDGGFEAGSPNPVWDEASTNFGTPLCTAGGCGVGGGTGPHSGSWWAWFGGIETSVETGSVSQNVTIPSAGSAELRFWLEIPVADSTGFLDVSLDGDVLFSVTEADGPSIGYTEVVVDVSEYADGGTYELRFDSTTQPGAGPVNFFVDDVSITVGGGGGEGCDNPTTIPWLSVTPDSGDTGAGETDLASVMVDATGLAPDIYSALLCVNSNDPVNPVVEVPVNLTVVAEGPIADITPESFAFELPQGGDGTDPLNVGNAGTADLEWSITEDVPAPALGAGDPVDFPADPGSLGPIPDSPGGCQEPGAPRDVTFAVSGLPTGTLADVQVAVTAEHTWVGDLVATLIAPDGTTMFDLFGYTGAIDDVSAGDSTNLGASYTFSDGADAPPSGGWWQEAAAHETDGIMSAGTYRTTQRGGAGTPNPAPATELTAAFAGVTDPNGTWTLRVTDGCGFDTGQVTAATLTLTPGTPPICDDVTDAPWLSATPTSGVTEPGATDVVDVTADATGLDVGTYEAALCVTTNDPLAPTVTVPVTLLVTEAVPEPVPTALVVDPDEFISSNGNLVFEPGEVAHVAPSWQNTGGASVDLSGTAMNYTGPAGANYTTVIDSATYGVVAGGATASCLDLGVEMCYALGVDDPVDRPAAHWDATFDEHLSEGTVKTWTLHVGSSFTDVVDTNLFYSWIETLFHARVTGGCAPGQYCPAGPNTRGQMAVFLLKAFEGPGYAPPDCVEGSEVFADVPFDNLFCSWIEELAGRGVTAGCGGGNYCPNSSVSRDQMSVFLLKTLEGSGYTPPACTGVFGDVPCPSLFANWIEDLVARSITAGCGGGNYCPASPVSRDQMAVFLTRTFGLALYGP